MDGMESQVRFSKINVYEFTLDIACSANKRNNLEQF